jgi:hypothetical protein
VSDEKEEKKKKRECLKVVEIRDRAGLVGSYSRCCGSSCPERMMLKKADVVRWNLNKVEKSARRVLLAGVEGKNPEHLTFSEFLTQPLGDVLVTKLRTRREKRNSIFLEPHTADLTAILRDLEKYSIVHPAQ